MTLLAGSLAALPVGCQLQPKGDTQPDPLGDIPSPINLLLPRTLEVHPFTQTSAFSSGDTGIHARVQARDAYGDPTKAFGDFRFELYEFRPHAATPRGQRLATWEVSLTNPEQNITHWDRHTASYEFKLGGIPHLPAGRKLVFVAVYTSPYSPRITAERELVVE
jgi:hypothetical protein